MLNFGEELTNIFCGVPMPSDSGKPFMESRLENVKHFERKDVIEMKIVYDKLEHECMPKKPFNQLRLEMSNMGNGIFKKILIEGFGDHVEENTVIRVQYTLFTENSNTTADSTYIAQKPYTFILGKEPGILPGFEAAIRTMRNQEKAEFIVPYQLLYGEKGAPSKVDGHQDGFYVIEVIRVSNAMKVDERCRLLNDFPAITSYVQELRERGKAAFTGGFYRLAANEYTEAVSLLRNALIHTAVDNKKRLELLIRMYLNAGITYNKLELPNFAISMLTRAIHLNDTGVSVSDGLLGKILLHASRSLRSMYRIREAFIYLKRAQDCLGDVQETRDELHLLYKTYDKYIEQCLIAGPLCGALETEFKESRYSYKSMDIFGVTFKEMMKKFIASEEKHVSVYGLQEKENIQLAKTLADRQKLKCKVGKDEYDNVCYSLTKI